MQSSKWIRFDFRDPLIETSGRGTQVKAVVVPSPAHRPVILRLSDSSINRCRHGARLRLSGLTVWARVKSHQSHWMKWTATATSLFVVDQVNITVKWINRTDVPVDVEPAPPRQLLTCCISKRINSICRALYIYSLALDGQSVKQDGDPPIQFVSLPSLLRERKKITVILVTVCWLNVG